jgi:diaminohydroxyphosphoribosylaminopyrimidine deaminase/5-amino-6-(5-phosphoribosylamino)uracil reductase
MFRPTDEKMMSRAIALAAQDGGDAHPNPRVGCVIVRRGRVVGEGSHVRFGGPHAEVRALDQAGERARGATVYVTLEPCPHWGKTPPCAAALIRAGVARVVVATTDPSSRLNGRGLALLRRSGLRVQAGLMARRAESLNRGFFQRQRTGRPHVILKMAQTLDGKIASWTGTSRWITGPLARKMGHRLRAESDAVLVGAETVRRDNPLLTAHGAGPNPVRIVLSGSLKVNVKSKVFGPESPTWILTGGDASLGRIRALEKTGAQVISVSGRAGEADPLSSVVALGKRGITQLLVEGGGHVAARFLSAGLIDEVYLFVAPLFLGGKDAPTGIEGKGWSAPALGPRLRQAEVKRVGDDWLIHGFLP